MLFRSAAALFAALLLPVPPASAQDRGPAGTWAGRYVCGQGVTALTLVVEQDGAGSLRAVFDFHADPANPGVPEGCFAMSGRHDPATGDVSLVAGRWLLQPPDYVTVDLDGRISRDGFAGRVRGPWCSGFVLRRQPGGADSINPACRPRERLLSSAR